MGNFTNTICCKMTFKFISTTPGAIFTTLAVLISCVGANKLLGTFYYFFCLDWSSFGSPICSGTLALMSGGAGIYTYVFYLIVVTVGLIVVNLLKSILTSKSPDSRSPYQKMGPTQKVMYLDNLRRGFGLQGRN